MSAFIYGFAGGFLVCFVMTLATPRYIMNTGYKTGGKDIYTDGRGHYYTLEETTLKFRKHEHQKEPFVVGAQ